MTPKDAFFAGWAAHQKLVATGASFTAAAIWDSIRARQAERQTKSALSGWGAFAAALKRVLPASDVRGVVPALECVLLESSGGVLTLTCTDMELTLVERIEAPGLPDMTVCVNAKLLFNVVKSFPLGGAITYALEGSASDVLKIGGATLATLSAEDFPRGSAPAWQQSFSLPADVLLGALNAVKLGIPNEETRYYLNGVHLCIQGEKLVFVASDGGRLFLKSVGIPPGAEKISLILPKLAVNVLLPLLAERSDTVKVELTDSRMRFSIGDVHVTTKLIDGTFPKFERVIPRGNTLTVTFDAAQLRDAVQAVKQISKERSQLVKFELGPDYARVSAKNAECGTSVRDIAPIEPVSFIAEIGFQARYLIDTLSCVEGPVKIAFCAHDETPDIVDSAVRALFTTPHDDSWLSVIMPMRL
jgi:DNA polymerase-3 subunit beta